MHGAVKQHRHADVRLDDEDPDGDLDEDKVWTASRNDMVAIQLGAAGQPRRIPCAVEASSICGPCTNTKTLTNVSSEELNAIYRSAKKDLAGRNN